MPKALRVRWAKKILGAKHFVVVTDSDAVIALAGIKPDSIRDLTMLSEQAASIDNFITMLQQVQSEHDERIQELTMGRGNHASKPSRKSTTKSIKVKEK